MKGSPAFSFYPRDFLGDPKVLALSTVEVGIYILILAAMWQEGGTLPNDSEFLRKLARMDPRWWKARWKNVSGLLSTKNDGQLLWHKRLDEERKLQQANALARTAAGKRGAAARWQGHSDRIATAMANDGSASASATALTENDFLPSLLSEGTAVPEGSSKEGSKEVEVGTAEPELTQDRSGEIKKLVGKAQRGRSRKARRKTP